MKEGRIDFVRNGPAEFSRRDFYEMSFCKKKKVLYRFVKIRVTK